MLFSLLLFLSSPAFADKELAPMEPSAPALVRSVEDGGVYHPIPIGERLEFDVTGPVTLNVELRQRLPSADATVDTVKVQAKGDGMLILTVKVKKGPDGGSILDGQGGVPTRADKAEITVPPGQHIFSLEPVDAPYPMLARVTALGVEGEPVLAEVEPEPQPEPDPIVEPEPEPEIDNVWGMEDVVVDAEPEPEPEPVEVEREPESGDIWGEDEDDLEAILTSDEPLPELETDEPEPEEGPGELEDADVVEDDDEPIDVEALFDDDDDDVEIELDDVETGFVPENFQPTYTETETERHKAIAFRVGAGGAAAGNEASIYLGLEGLIGLSEDTDLSVRLGQYAIGYNASIPIQPALGGYDGVAQEVDWTTRVRAAELGVRYTIHDALPAGLAPYGHAAVAGYWSTRIDGPDKTRGLGTGLGFAAGLDIPVGPGALAPELAVNTGRGSFGNTNIQGTDARERLGGWRGNLTYRVDF